MSADMPDLAAARAANSPSAPGTDKERTESVVRMFNDSERMGIVTKQSVLLTLGTPPLEVHIMPMSVGQLLKVLPMLKQLLAPLLAALKERKAGETLAMGTFIEMLMESLGDHPERLPELIQAMLERGNNITIPWIENNFDFVPDMQQLLPVFLKQNGLDKLFNLGKQAAPSPTFLPSDGAKTEMKDAATTSTE